jgi:hypothetical protein
VYFYELREGDEEIYSDLVLVRDEPMSPEDFFELVQSIRRRIQDTFEDDTLIEAVAAELEREHGFVAVTDERLEASVNVSVYDDENYLVDKSAEDEVDEEDLPDYKAILVDLDPSIRPDRN